MRKNLQNEFLGLNFLFYEPISKTMFLSKKISLDPQRLFYHKKRQKSRRKKDIYNYLQPKIIDFCRIFGENSTKKGKFCKFHKNLPIFDRKNAFLPRFLPHRKNDAEFCFFIFADSVHF